MEHEYRYKYGIPTCLICRTRAYYSDVPKRCIDMLGMRLKNYIAANVRGRLEYDRTE